MGSDTITYQYGTTPWYPEAAYLYEVTDIKTGKPNKNNVTSIQLKVFDNTGGIRDYWKSIQYTYIVKGKRLAKVKVVGSSVKGINVNNEIGFTYKCD